MRVCLCARECVSACFGHPLRISLPCVCVRVSSCADEKGDCMQYGCSAHSSLLSGGSDAKKTRRKPSFLTHSFLRTYCWHAFHRDRTRRASSASSCVHSFFVSIESDAKKTQKKSSFLTHSSHILRAYYSHDATTTTGRREHRQHPHGHAQRTGGQRPVGDAHRPHHEQLRGGKPQRDHKSRP